MVPRFMSRKCFLRKFFHPADAVRRLWGKPVLSVLSGVLLFITSSAAQAETGIQRQIRLETQKAQYDADVSKSIVDLQQFRTSDSITLKSGESVTLTNLNPEINTWFLMSIADAYGQKKTVYHIENVDPDHQTLRLASDPAFHLSIEGGRSAYRCIPWGGAHSPLVRAQKTGLPFAPFCGGHLYMRNKVRGHSTTLEATSQFLRDNVWLGENIVGFVKDAFFKDSAFQTSEVLDAETSGVAPKGLIKARLEKSPVVRSYFSLELDGVKDKRVTMGAWYPVTGLAGVYAATLQPQFIARDILRDGGTARRLDSIEGRAMAFFVAFDLTKFSIGYEVGTDHPRLDWSSRPSGAGRNWNTPGPDGVATALPLKNMGMVSPRDAARIVATFTGGFKRDHGAFRYGPYATQNHGTHYGFIVHGVVESKLQPNLSTLYVLKDGTMGMKTWTQADNKMLPKIRFARQNGVALVERDSETGQSMAGALVPQWGAGNWSGSAKAELRTLRAGMCLREADGKRFLIYGYFSTATPSAMARTFQAFSCDYAMLNDMNAPEHTYSALYVRKDGALQTQHLLRGMSAFDKKLRDGARSPRFVGFADNRDFFYLLKRENVK